MIRPPRLSTFPLHKPFEKQATTTSMSEVGHRLVVNAFSDNAQVIGTATIIAGHLLLTARHVLDAIVSSTPCVPGHNQINNTLHAFQLLPGPEYLVWDVIEAWPCPVSDIALLHLGSNPYRSHPEKAFQWRQPRLNAFAPEIGETVAAFGYRKMTVGVSINSRGGRHIELNDEPMISVGKVKDIYELRRDNVFLPFPCYQVSARFDGGMSGGPVYDETGLLCGLVCSNVHGSHKHGEPISYVTSLWPMFRQIISADRGDNYPRGVDYQVIELARGNQISVPELNRLEQWLIERGENVP